MKAGKIWLVMSVLVVASVALVAQAGDYVGDSKCKMCHKTQHASWLETTHAKALDDAKGAENYDKAACVTCHATNSDEAMPGVQCEACHGPGSDYKKMSIMKDREKAVANGLVIPDQAVCDACHTGDDHSSKKVLADEKGNNAAIHAFKE